jgi:hypothetical protein
MPRARGFKAFVGLAKEAQYGTPIATPTNYLRIRSESLTHNKETKFDQALGTFWRRAPIDTKVKAAGDIVTNMQFNGLELLLWNLFGYNNVPAVSSGVGTWTFSTNQVSAGGVELPTGLTTHINRDIAKFVFTGCKVAGATFKMVPDDVGEVTWNIIGQRLSSTSDTCDTPTYPTDVPVLARYGVLKLAGESSARTTVKTGSINFKNVLAEDDYPAVGQYACEPVRLGVELAADLTLWFTSRADYELFRASTDAAVSLAYTADIYAGGTTYYSWTWAIPKTRISPSADPTVSGRGLIEMPVKMEGFYDMSTEPVVLTVVNAMTSTL